MAVFASLRPGQLEAGLARLQADLVSGRWQERNHELDGLEALDLGHRLVVSR
jgi:hypothetical protein